ncbi:YheC/D like ATP-grasp [Marininema mesophilum]|uniref:YheC/D like ATP-grasp n=1 Tax=Marininema mesophilum TaxID=1048340 RepID=A0A1H2XYK4_9BACL|nr:YheC/YheD family protein [Marininema mesophilum]SDW97658.1 YheC/D like ATP-grasp [Marininema mesophilum]
MGHVRLFIQIVSERTFPQRANIIMSHSLANRLNLPSHPIWVTFGSSSDTALIHFSETNSPLIRISSRLASQLKLHGDIKTLNAHYDPPSRRLQLGPFFGVLLNRDVQGSEDQLFGDLSGFLEECARVATNRGIFLCIFPPEGIRPDQGLTQGWLWDNKRWQTCEGPLPDIIYNRITSRRVEKEPSVQQKLEKLRKEHQIKIFNESFLDKRQVHEILSKDESMKRFLPDTIPWNTSHLRAMVQRYRTVFLKPIHGSLGQGIIRVSLENNKWVCQYAKKTGTVTHIFPRFYEAIQKLRQKTSRSRYIIQKGLDLITIDGRSVDFRILAQRNSFGNWAITSSVARLANDSHIVSNLAKGGTLRKTAEVLSEAKVIGVKPTIFELRDTALAIANSFEKLAQGHYAELGIDLVLDQRGQLWLIELNSKPSKTIDTLPNTKLTVRPSVVRLIDYVTYCTGWTPYMSARKSPRARSKQKPSGRKK